MKGNCISIGRTVLSVGAEEASCLHFGGVDDERWVLPNLLLHQILGHEEELVEVYAALASEILIDELFAAGLLGALAEFVGIDAAIDGLVGIEGFLDLDDFLLAESLVEVLLHLEVFESLGVGRLSLISHCFKELSNQLLCIYQNLYPSGHSNNLSLTTGPFMFCS